MAQVASRSGIRRFFAGRSAAVGDAVDAAAARADSGAAARASHRTGLRVPRPGVLCAIMAVAIVLRIAAARFVGVWFWALQHWDDTVLLRYSLPGYYSNPSDDGALMKVTGYSQLLRVVRILHLNYPTLLALLWVAAALVVFFLVRAVSRRPWLSVAAFLYTLFYPAAFEANIGTRMYRNSILIPCYVVVIGLVLLMTWRVLSRTARPWPLIGQSVLMTAALVYTYWVKEDGLWMVACMAAAAAVCIVAQVVICVRDRRREVGESVAEGNHDASAASSHASTPDAAASSAPAAPGAPTEPAAWRRIVAVIVAFAIPFAGLAASSVVYKSVNRKYFGAYVDNTRLGGETGRFVEYLYAIDAPGRSSYVWAPADAIRQAFDASPTLQSHPELYQAIVHTPWIVKPDHSNITDTIFETPIPGDSITWVLHSALVETGLWTSQEAVNDLFAQVNSEIQTAFDNGTLKKSHTIQPLASVGGYTKREIAGLVPYIAEGYAGVVFLAGYTPGAKHGDYLDNAATNGQTKQIGATAAEAFGLPYLADYTLRSTNRYALANTFVILLFWAYRILNTLLLIALAIVLIGGIVRLVRRRRVEPPVTARSVMTYLLLVAAVGVSVVYSTVIQWYNAFLYHNDGFSMTWSNYYDLGAVAMQILIFALAACILASWREGRAAASRSETARVAASSPAAFSSAAQASPAVAHDETAHDATADDAHHDAADDERGEVSQA